MYAHIEKTQYVEGSAMSAVSSSGIAGRYHCTWLCECTFNITFKVLF